MKKSFLVFTIILSFLFFLFTSCEKESFTTDKADKLNFSLDTLMFDTIFTEIGSITKSFKVINNHDKSIKISEVGLSKKNDFFHINIDGVAADQLKDIELLPFDSIYIFVEVTIDPNLPLSLSPYIIEDEVRFLTNGNEQKVLLTAWGQNANYLPRKNGKGIDYGLICGQDGSITWDDPKPYVIYGRMFIDSCELILPEGCQIYVHGGIAIKRQEDNSLLRYNDGAIVIYNKGKLTVKGTVDNPVVIQGDRLDEDYKEVYGQWVGFYFLNQTKNNIIEHAIIKNAIRAVFIDSASELSIKSSTILNTLGSGIEARHANVNVQNSLIYNNLSSAIRITYGGVYNIDYCTLVGNENNGAAFEAINYTCSDFSVCNDARFYPLNLNLKNNIIIGDQKEELFISGQVKGNIGPINYEVQNCIISKDKFDQFFKNCISYNNKDTLFIESEELDFHLDTFSIAERMALPLHDIDYDMDDITRDAVNPDIGCFEFIE